MVRISLMRFLKFVICATTKGRIDSPSREFNSRKQAATVRLLEKVNLG